MAKTKEILKTDTGYKNLLSGVVELLENSRRAAARSVDSVMTTTYWDIGRRIVEHEQGGKKRAGYGEKVLKLLSKDLSSQFGKGFSVTNLKKVRKFYLVWQIPEKGPTASDQFTPHLTSGTSPTPSCACMTT